MADDDETPETALWRQTVERLLANGSSPVEALDGANLIVQAYRRQLAARAAAAENPENPPGTSGASTIDVQNPQRASGVRRRISSKKFRAK